MMPNNAISATLQWAPLLPPDTVIPPNEMIAYQQGGIALNDPSKGLQVQMWTLQAIPTGGVLDPVDLIISAPSVAPTTLQSVVGVTSVSLAFDQNMQPAIAYVANGHAKLWWYDTTIPGYTTIDFGIDVTYPRICLDDKRAIEVTIGDTSIILGYIKNDNFYTLSQADRFTIEYLQVGDISTRVINPQLWKIAMNKGNRLQFFFKGNLYQ